MLHPPIMCLIIKSKAALFGGSGYGLATACYLAKNHGMRKVAVLKRALLAAAMLGETPASCGRITAKRAILCFISIR